MHGMQSMGSHNTGGQVQNMGNHDTGGQFRSRLPLQLQTFGRQGSNQPAVGGASPAAEEAGPGEIEDEDDLPKLEADFTSATKAEARIRKQQQLLEQQ